MIIGFTGAQSTGKTTLLNACKEIYKDEFAFIDEVTRAVQREYNVSINEDGTDITQLLIINRHIENMMKTHDTSKRGLMLDRCIVDGLVYTGYLALEGKVSKWVLNYAKNVLNILVPRMHKIFYTDPVDVKLIDDGVRSVDLDFREKIIHIFDIVFELYDEQLMNKVVRLKGTVEERLEQIKMTLC